MYKFTLRLSVHRGANHDQSIRRLHRCGRSCHGGRDRSRNRAISPSSGSGNSCASDRGSPATAPTKPVVSPKKKVAAASGPSIAGKWSGQLTQADNPPPTNSSSLLAPKGPRRSILISIAQGNLRGSDRRNPMSFLSRSSAKAAQKKVAVARTALSPSRGKATSLPWHGLAAFRAKLSSRTALYRKSRSGSPCSLRPTNRRKSS